MAKQDIEKYNKLVDEYRKLAKRADDRLRRLEVYQHEKNFKTATKYAYSKARKNIKKWGGYKRFNTAPPDSVTSLQAKINDIKTFLNAPSSTKRGIISIYKKRAETINELYGADFTWQDMGNYFELGTNEKFEKHLSSKSALMVIGTFQDAPKDIKEMLIKGKGKNIKIDSDFIENFPTEEGKKVLSDWKTKEKINELLKDNSINWKDLL